MNGPAGLFFTNAYGYWEFPAFWIIGLIGLALTDNGVLALRPPPRRWRSALSHLILEATISASVPNAADSSVAPSIRPRLLIGGVVLTVNDLDRVQAFYKPSAGLHLQREGRQQS